MEPVVIPYVRWSTPEQEMGDSERRQLEAIEAYALERGMGLAKPVYDRGISAYRGKNAKTGALAGLLAHVEAREFPAGSEIVCESLDRISRQGAYDTLVGAVGRIAERGMALVTLTPRETYSQATFRSDWTLMIKLTVHAQRAQSESDVKSSRISGTWVAKRRAARTKPMTAVCPGWLVLDKESNTFRLIPERAEVVRRVFAEYLGGTGTHSIAEGLNRDGVPVFGEGKRKGKQWHRSYVVKLLENPAVIGRLEPHVLSVSPDGIKRRTRLTGEELEGYYPPAIPEDVWARVRTLRETKSPRRGIHAAAPVFNIFGGIAKCARCGATMTRVNKGSGGKTWHYLACTRARSGAGCKYTALPYGEVEDGFLTNVAVLLADAPAGEAAAGIEEELGQITVELEALRDAYDDAWTAMRKQPSPSTAATMRRIERERDALKERERELLEHRKLASGPLVARRLADLGAACAAPEIDRGAINLLMRQVFSGILVDPDGLALRGTYAHGGDTDWIRWSTRSPFQDESDHPGGYVSPTAQ
jgi:DNA invertase Pin-like site-specific DNA recombinase